MLRKRGHSQAKPAANKGKSCSLNPSLTQQSVAKRKTVAKNSRRTQGAAWRLAGRLGGMLALLALVSAMLLGGWWWASDSPAFAVTRVEVLGTNHLGRLQVLRTAGVGAHSNLLALPVGKISHRLMGLPWLDAVELRRRLPGNLYITVHERRPRLLALVEGRLQYLDQKLLPLAPVGRRPVLDLPVLTGLSRKDLLAPDEEALRLMKAVKALLAVLPSQYLEPGGRLGEIHLDRVWGLSLVFNDLPPTVRMGFGGYAGGLARLKAVRADLERRGELSRAKLIDLESERRTVVRLGRGNA